MGTNINFNKVLGVSKGCNITLASNTVPPLLLDTYPNAAVAYSLRKLRNGYTGSAVRVRRFVDNTEQDFGFDINGDLDTDAIVNFFGNNLLVQSENFASTSWSKGTPTVGSVVSTGVILAPNGIDMADKLDENTTNGTHLITQASGTLTLGGAYFLSIYLKAAERNIVDIVSGIAGSSQVLRVNLTTGSVVSNGFANSPTITSVGSDWWKVELFVTSAVTSTPTGLQVRLTNGATQSYIGTVGSGCYVWGAQVSGYIGSTIPYFKTTTVRAADAFVATWYDQSINGNNAFQNSVLGSQAQIIANGLKIIAATTNKLTTTWTSDVYTLTTGINPNTRYLSIGVVNRTANTNNIVHIGVAGAFGGSNGQTPLVWFATTGEIRSAMAQSFIHGLNTSTGAFITTSEKNSSNLKTLYLNGTAFGLTSTEVPAAGSVINSFGHSGGTTTSCQYQEYIYWNIEQSANRVAIETEINDYYNVY